MIRSFRSIQKVQIENQYFTLCRPIRCSTFATRSDTSTEDEQNEARQWLATFTPDTIPRRLGEISFSRSSGPGGQNVNKYVISPLPNRHFIDRIAQNQLQGHLACPNARHSTPSDSSANIRTTAIFDPVCGEERLARRPGGQQSQAGGECGELL